MPFTHLHLHTEYSFLDGAIRIKELAVRLKELGLTSCAVTDHGNMTGCLKFYKELKAAGIKPIFGMEAYITDDVDNKETDKTRDNYHLVMLAKDEVGLKNLFALSSQAFRSNYYYKPRISTSNLNPESTKGIIALSACMGSNLNRCGKNKETGYDKQSHD